MTEIQPYTVEETYPEFELRRYPDHQVVEVDVSGSFFEAGNRGFGPLIGYISGNNEQRRQISMTAPVIQTPRTQGGQTVSFVMPSAMDASAVPTPTNTAVRPRAVPGGLVAARVFSGGSNTARYEDNSARLLAALALEGLTPDGEVYFARYDPPWKPGFLKRNEALVRLAGSQT